MRNSQRLLTVDSGEVKADVLVVLGGGSDERPERAVELFKAGAAQKILVSGAGDCELNVAMLEKSGVPASAIMREDRSTNTLENAKLSVPLLHQMGARRVILVTTWYHSRRALACFEHFAPDITFYSRPSYFGYQRKDWNRRDVGDHVLAELVKLPGYWVCHGICPYSL
ncbi:MAG: YdcF family protein [Methylacidiphilales bacterium]|nr:YdcF family protein [Candidatus Methylacidiphilales bacterium]